MDRAKLINDLLIEYGIGGGFTARSGSHEVATLIREIQAAHVRANKSGGHALSLRVVQRSRFCLQNFQKVFLVLVIWFLV